MQQKLKMQQGSLMIEIIAVVGLVALIMPVVYRQISKRSEEIVNTQIATEIRAVKDAVTASIRANEGIIAERCGLKDGNGEFMNVTSFQKCDDITWESDFENLVQDNTSLTETVLDGYDVVLYSKTVPQSTDKDGNPTSYAPVIYAVVGNTGVESANLRQASKVASLIGLEGGITTTDGIKGMQGAWVLNNTKNWPNNTVVATTSFDAMTGTAVLRDATFQHLNASATAQAPTMATKKLGVKEILSVDAPNDECIAGYGNGTISIKNDGTDTCSPFFEVDANTQEVTLRGVIKSPTTTTTCSKHATKGFCEAASGCVWNPDLNKCTNEYLLDPSGVSLVKDIRLQSRGGAKLSEILPKWILMKIRTETTSPATLSDNFDCPNEYDFGITVTPIEFKQGATTDITITTNEAQEHNATKGNVSVSFANASKVLIHEYCVYTGS